MRQLLWTLLVVFVLCMFAIWGVCGPRGFGVRFELLGWLTAMLVLVEIGIVVLVLVHRRQAGARMEKDLLEAGRKAAEEAKPDRQKEIVELNQTFAQSLSVLSRSQAGGAYALPWYVIVGPPGTGKTTAIRESGLPFPLEKGAKALRGTGGTRNCHWWFTNDAVLLDTAGRYSGEADQEEWFAFLDLLKRHRARKPINGLIVALSVADLASASQKEIAGIAALMRARLDEVTTRLKMRVPIYVMLSKADLVAGFTEFWNDLRPSEREQAWGMGFALNETTEPKELVARSFDLLVRTLYARGARRLHAERRVAMRRALWSFPQEFATLRDNVSEFVAQLFAKNAYQETPLLRGVYFTSGTQNQRPTSRVLESMGQAFGIRLSNTLSGPLEPKSYFLTDMFRRVIFPDRHLAGQTAAERRRQLIIRACAFGFCLSMSGLLVAPAFLTWMRNRELIASTSETEGAIRAVDWTKPAGLEKNIGRLDAARERLTQLAGWNQDGAPSQLRWGMYVGDGLYPSLRGVYVAALSRLVIVPTKKDLEDRLRALDPSPVRTSDHFNRDVDTLKLYLMLGDPQHMDPEWAAPRLLKTWSETPHGNVSDAEGLLMAHVKDVFTMLHHGELRPWDLDDRLIKTARSILAQTPQTDRVYETLIRDSNATIQSIKRERVFYGSSAKFIQSKKGVRVPGAYTKAGWQNVRKLLGEEREKLAAEQWVLADAADASGQTTIDKLRQLYFERYQAAWHDFLDDLFVQDPQSADVALEELKALAEPEYPYLRLIRLLSDNVTLEMDDDKGVVEKAVDKAKEVLDGGSLAPKHVASPVERAFRPMLRFALPPEGSNPDNPPPTQLSQYIQALGRLIAALADLHDADTGTDPHRLDPVFEDAVRTTEALVLDQDPYTRDLLRPLLFTPITNARLNVVKDAGGAAGALWEATAWAKWHEKLEGRYPFVTSSSDAALEDFLDFFAPGDGTLWAFYDESLKATLDHNGSSFVPSRRFRSSVSYAPDFLDVCLRRGDQITKVLFPPKTDHAAVTFSVNLHSVSPTIGEVTLEVDGVSHTYRNEPEQWMTVTWPGTGPHGAHLRVRGAGGMNEQLGRPGDFGLFHLLDQADVKPGRAGGRSDGAPTLVATWDLKAATDGAFVAIDLRPTRNENPLSPGYFKDYTCPRTITNR